MLISSFAPKKKRINESKHILLVSYLIFILSFALTSCSPADNYQGPDNPSPQVQTENPATSTPTESPDASTIPGEDKKDVLDSGSIPAEGAESSPENVGTGVSGKLEVHFIDVGQADSILIIQNNAAMLIDAGNNNDAGLVKDYIKEKGIKRLDYAIGTHPHEDHIGGLDEVVKSFDIGKMIMPKAQANTKTFEDLLRAIQSKNLKVTTPVPGTEYRLGDARFVILAPNSSTYDDLNDYSVVIRLTYGSNSFLFTGDAEAVSEKEIIAAHYNIKSDVLKVGHHGSGSSTTSSFLKEVSPKHAIISVGQGNDYGHPTQKVLNLLSQNDITVYRTDIYGTITAISDGKDITFTFEKSEVQQKPKPTSTPKPEPSTPKPVPVTPKPQPGTGESKASGDKIIIEKVDLVGEIVILRNNGTKDVDLSGWKLLSVTGDQTFYFPKGCIIKAGSTLSIASGDAKGDLQWGGRNIWNNKGDRAELYDASGKLISSK